MTDHTDYDGTEPAAPPAYDGPLPPGWPLPQCRVLARAIGRGGYIARAMTGVVVSRNGDRCKVAYDDHTMTGTRDVADLTPAPDCRVLAMHAKMDELRDRLLDAEVAAE